MHPGEQYNAYCTIKDTFDGSYLKFNKDGLENTVLMEYKYLFYSTLKFKYAYFPHFIEWLEMRGPDRLYDFTDYFAY